MSKRPHVVIGMDMGGTNLRLGIVDAGGNDYHIVNSSIGCNKSVEAIVPDIIRRIEALLAICGEKSLEVEAICLSAPGIISRDEGTIAFSPNLPGWENVPLRDVIAGRFGLPTILENDANAAAFGEFWKGGGQGTSHMVMFTLGTGVGGGVIADGRLIRGCRGMAGELGHMTVVSSNGRLCRCGNHGCLEAYSSATAIVERTRVNWTGEGPPPETAREACRMATEGDELCLEIFREAGFYLGVALADVVNVLNPEVIVIGGGVVEAWNIMMPWAEEELKSRAFKFTDLAEKVSIRKALLGDKAGVIGSAGIYWNEVRN